MSLVKFFQVIDKSKIGKFIDKKMNVLEATDPNRIYVENIRSFYNLPTFVAKFFCEMAVKENLFLKKTGVYCPECERMVMSVEKLSQIPKKIKCDNCELLEKNNCEFTPKEKNLLVFYQLNENTNG